jgi:hypothetical protein
LIPSIFRSHPCGSIRRGERFNGSTIERFNDSSTIERLQALGLSRFWAAAIPVLIFSVGHSTSG